MATCRWRRSAIRLPSPSAQRAYRWRVNRADVLVLLDYLSWTRDRILASAAELEPEEFTAPETVTNRGLRATLVHELDVQWSWRERLRTGAFPDADDLDPTHYATVAALAEHWRHDEQAMRAWLDSLTDAQLAMPPPAETSPLPLWHYVMHLVSHAIQQFTEAAVLLTRADHSPDDIGFLEFAASRR